MKRKLILFLLLCVSLTVHANPGDDIWIKIKELYALAAIANQNIQHLWESVHEVQTTTQNLQTQIDNLPEGKQGPAGPQGEKGESGPSCHYVAGEGIEIEGEVIRSVSATHQVGESYHGGIIFWLDETKQHGLIASKIDAGGQGIQWRNGASGNKVTNAKGDGIGAGETNTRLIIAQQTIDNQKGIFAALSAANFQVLEDGMTPCQTPISPQLICYGGWYLPSAYELQLLHNILHQNNLSAFAPEFYWSSTEADVSNAWLQNFSTGEMLASSKSNTLGRVRPISRF